MKNVEILIKAFNVFGSEYEILDILGRPIYQSNLYNNIKTTSKKLDRNIFKCNDSYYEFSRKYTIIDDTTYYINFFNDITKYQNDILMLKEDVLTTLPNRFAIESFLNSHVGTNFIVLICDIDDFKRINDTYGHPQGDVVLSELGRILKSLINQNNFAGRYGGEEFVLFFENTDLKHVKEQLNNVRRQMRNNPNLNNDKYCINISTGMSIMRGDTTSQHAIKEADIALYFVKNNGKNADAIYNCDTNTSYIIE